MKDPAQTIDPTLSFIELTLKNTSYNDDLISPEYDALMREFVELVHDKFSAQHGQLFSLRQSLLRFLLHSDKVTQEEIVLGCLSFLIYCVEQASKSNADVQTLSARLKQAEAGSGAHTSEYATVQSNIYKADAFIALINSINQHHSPRSIANSPGLISSRRSRSNSVTQFFGTVFSPRRRGSTSSDSSDERPLSSSANHASSESPRTSPKSKLSSFRRS